jgi:hypothetical protein
VLVQVRSIFSLERVQYQANFNNFNGISKELLRKIKYKSIGYLLVKEGPGKVWGLGLPSTNWLVLPGFQVAQQRIPPAPSSAFYFLYTGCSSDPGLTPRMISFHSKNDFCSIDKPPQESVNFRSFYFI